MRMVMVEITAPSPEEAYRIGRALVEEGLASCANLAGPVRSIYRWQGRVDEAAETMLWVKTTWDALAALVDRIRALHSYECPCVIALPILGGNPAYLAWIEAECRPPHRSHAGFYRATD
jgi:periplasmic divalent cation tolerance protein